MKVRNYLDAYLKANDKVQFFIYTQDEHEETDQVINFLNDDLKK